MSDIETRLLRYFVAVAEAQHFAGAAERLGITPQTLTPQIQKLESQLGARLLRRKGHTKVAVTAAGRRVLALARDVLGQLGEAPTIAQQAERGELGSLQVGFTTVVSSVGLLRRWVRAFEQAHPAIDITIDKLVPTAQIGGIQRNELDAGFMRAPHKYPRGVRGFVVYRQPLALALASEHPLAGREEISPAMLAREAFVNITPELEVGFFGYTEAIGRIGNFVPRVVKRSGDFIGVLGNVALGRGIAVVPELMKTMNFDNVVFRNIAADPVPQTSIAFVYGTDPSPSAKLLIRHMQHHALRNHGSGDAPPHNHGPIMIPSALNLDPHPDEARATRLRSPRELRRGLSHAEAGARRRKRAPQGEEMSQR